MSVLRLYLDPAEIANDGYPYAWEKPNWGGHASPRIPDLVRQQAGHRCVRCGHPFVVGQTPGHWSPCDALCSHGGPVRFREAGRGDDGPWKEVDPRGITAAQMRIDEGPLGETVRFDVEAAWRILTVHHLNGVKHDCRWWNLVALCQRCHLTIQAKVVMTREYHREHSEWFKPYVAGFYASEYLGEELTRDVAVERLVEILAPFATALSFFGTITGA